MIWYAIHDTVNLRTHSVPLKAHWTLFLLSSFFSLNTIFPSFAIPHFLISIPIWISNHPEFPFAELGVGERNKLWWFPFMIYDDDFLRRVQKSGKLNLLFFILCFGVILDFLDFLRILFHQTNLRKYEKLNKLD